MLPNCNRILILGYFKFKAKSYIFHNFFAHENFKGPPSKATIPASARPLI